MHGYRKQFVWLTRHKLICFVIMTISFMTFGLLSADLVRLFLTNGAFIAEYGTLALKEGALRQLLELTVSACVAMLAYLLFKFCESALIFEFSREQKD